LHNAGIDYIHVGQQGTTPSSGEARRVKLAKGLPSALLSLTVMFDRV